MNKTLIKPGQKKKLTLQSPEDQLFILEQESELELFFPLWGEGSETKVRVELQGEGSRVESQVVFFGNKKDQYRLKLEHVHQGSNTVSHLLMKGALTDEARGHFWGGIFMEKGSIDAKGRLEEHALLLSPQAKIDTIPALEIAHNQVEASHAATVERFNEEQWFYLVSRGLTPLSAQKLLLSGFFKDALAKLSDDTLREQLLQKLFHSLPHDLA